MNFFLDWSGKHDDIAGPGPHLDRLPGEQVGLVRVPGAESYDFIGQVESWVNELTWRLCRLKVYQLSN